MAGIRLHTFWSILRNYVLEAIQTRTVSNFGAFYYMDRVKRIWYLSPMRAAKVQASLRMRAVSPEPSLLAHTRSESRGIFTQKARSLAPLNGWACAVKICHDGMLEDTNSLDGAHMFIVNVGLYKEPEFARTKIHQKFKQKHVFYLENTKIVQSVCAEVLFVLESKKTQVENVFPIEISVFSAAADIRYR